MSAFSAGSSLLYSILLLDRNEGEGRLSLAAEFPVHCKLGRAEEKLTAPVVQACSNLAEIAGPDSVFEADLVNPCVESDIAGNLVLYEDSTLS